ncbi:MAG: alpha/beta hydrolase [Bacteroidota bacterium]
MKNLGDEFRAPLISQTPMLFLSGTLDFNTPPYQAEEVRWGFSDAHHVIIENAGHEQVRTHPETNAIVLDFLQGKTPSKQTLAYPALKFLSLEGETGEDVFHPSVQ